MGLLAGVVAIAGIPATVKDGFLLAVRTPLLLFGLVHCLLLFQLQLLLHLGNEPVPLLLQALSHFSHGQFQVVFHLRELLLVQPLQFLNLNPQSADLSDGASSRVFGKIIVDFRHRALDGVHHFASVLGNVCSDVS